MLKDWKSKIFNNLAKENTMKQNLWDAIASSYAPSLMLVVYYLVPTGKTIMEKTISYEFWYVITAILMFLFVIPPLFKFLKQYRYSKIVR